jgi:uncharacterized protein (DUF2236 family)
MLLPRPSSFLRSALAGRVRSVFNDEAKGEKPVARSEHAYYKPNSVIWRVHGDVTTMMVGGVTALLLQMLHPAALAGIWDHSTFRDDMLGRLRRTARFIAVTTFGHRNDADVIIAKVIDVHNRVGGNLPDGTAYSANDPHLLSWVHLAEAVSFLDAWIRYGEPGMSAADQDQYFAEFADIAIALGADQVPKSRAEADMMMKIFLPELSCNARTKQVAHIVLNQAPPHPSAAPVQGIIMRAATDLLPRWARQMHGLKSSRALPAVRGVTSGIASTLRWAFTDPKA